MKKIFFLVLSSFFLTSPLHAYKILYAEQYYKLFHTHFYQYPEDINENIYWLQEALKADFANPLNALADIKTKEEWERYRYLFKMHVNLKLTNLYLTLGSKYDKREAYFYNAPWKDENLKSLKIAEGYYKNASYYWDQAKEWESKIEFSWTPLEKIANWEDEAFRIRSGGLDYEKIIESHLARLKKVRGDFMAMDEKTY